MNELMGILRRSLIVLVTTVIALTSAFDACLLDCHPQARVRNVQTPAHAHCHTVPASQALVPSTELGAGRWQADPTCHHDHSAAAAESAARSRLDLRLLGGVVSPATDPDRSVVSIVPVIRSTSDRSGPTVALIPLRV